MPRRIEHPHTHRNQFPLRCRETPVGQESIDDLPPKALDQSIPSMPVKDRRAQKLGCHLDSQRKLAHGAALARHRIYLIDIEVVLSKTCGYVADPSEALEGVLGRMRAKKKQQMLWRKLEDSPARDLYLHRRVPGLEAIERACEVGRQDSPVEIDGDSALPMLHQKFAFARSHGGRVAVPMKRSDDVVAVAT